MIYTNFANLDLSKYNRIFAFGCSFTGYRWPTWADIISWQNPQAEYHNLARSGAGQLFIVSQLSQIINKHQLGPDDLVMTMWSTFYREDRYLHGRKPQNWSTPGNIFTAQHEIPQEYVDQYVCTRGMFVRDLALIDTTMRMLSACDFDSISALSVSMEHQNWTAGIQPDQQGLLDDVIELYKPLEQSLAPSLLETQFYQGTDHSNSGWQNTYKYWDDDMQSEYADYHPSVEHYLEYLEKLGLVANQQVHQRVQQEHQRMTSVTHKSQLRDHVPCLIL